MFNFDLTICPYADALATPAAPPKIGRASCRGKGENSVGAGSFKKKKKKKNGREKRKIKRDKVDKVNVRIINNKGIEHSYVKVEKTHTDEVKMKKLVGMIASLRTMT